MRIFLFLVFIIFSLLSCNLPECICTAGEETVEGNKKFISDYYKSPFNLPSQFWYSLQEPNMFTKNQSRIRLLIQDRETKEGYIYRIEKEDEKSKLIIKDIGINDLDNTLSVLKIDSFDLEEKEWRDLLKFVNSHCFYTLKSDIQEDDIIEGGNLQILEFKNIGKECLPSTYSLSVRVSPEHLREQNLSYNLISSYIMTLR